MRRITAFVPAIALLLAACAARGTAVKGEPADAGWLTGTLTDVATGETFRIDDFRGKVVAIESMAVWCLNCRIQQGEARAALDQVGSSDVVYISLDVDPNERVEDLAEYARREGFPWRFAIAPATVSRALADQFGEQTLSPPATPLVILGPDGLVIQHSVGIKRAAELAALFAEHLP